MEWAKISHASEKYPHELSSGMRTRAALAMLIAYRPRLYLLDEAFAHLDEIVKEEFLKDFERLSLEALALI